MLGHGKGLNTFPDKEGEIQDYLNWEKSWDVLFYAREALRSSTVFCVRDVVPARSTHLY